MAKAASAFVAKIISQKTASVESKAAATDKVTAAGGAATLSCRIMFKDGKSALVAKEEPNRSHEEDVKIKVSI